ncbi:MAG TPA: T9SS type A sorting domain-containing protein [Bacteroidota bacterium]|nr:T9SS type A sorting domain-containing protein [Bacteroidota bacterium]
MNSRCFCIAALIAAVLPAIALGQWERVNSGLGSYKFIRNETVVVATNPCANVYYVVPPPDSIKACVPFGTSGMLAMNAGSGVWAVSYSNGIAGYTRTQDLTHPPANVESFGVIGCVVFAGTGRNAFRSTDNGNSWTQMNSGFLCPYTDYWNVPRFRVIGGTMFAQNAYNPYSTTDSGATWQMIGSPFNFHLSNLDASRTCLFGMCYNGTYLRSRTLGAQWDTITCPGTLAIIDTILFAQHPDGQIDASFDDGNSWKTVNAASACPGMAWSFCSSGNFLLDLEGPDSLDMSLIRRQWRDSVLVVMRCSHVPPGLQSGVPAGSLATSGQYAMLDYGGTYFSTNSGDTWTSLSLPSDVPACPPFAVTGNYLFVGGTGVWREPLDPPVSAALQPNPPSAPTLSQNYPNPFNPGTTIRYYLPQRSGVTLRVFDPLGRVVATLVNSEVLAGEHTVSFDGGRMASGVYFCQLQAGSYVRTMKLLLIK